MNQLAENLMPRHSAGVGEPNPVAIEAASVLCRTPRGRVMRRSEDSRSASDHSFICSSRGNEAQISMRTSGVLVGQSLRTLAAPIFQMRIQEVFN